MNLVALVLLTLHIFIVSCVDAGQVVLTHSNITSTFEDMEADFWCNDFMLVYGYEGLKQRDSESFCLDFAPLVNATTVETGVLHVAEPLDGCRYLKNKLGQSTNGTSRFVLIIRGGCDFEYKVRNAQRRGFKAAIVYDNVDRDILFTMGGDPDGIKIRAVFVTKAAGEALKNYAGLTKTEVMLVPSSDSALFATIALISSVAIFVVLATCVFVNRRCGNDTSQFHGMSRRMVKAMPSFPFICAKEDNTTSFSCAICLEDYSVGDKLRVLPCSHKFHAACIDLWLTSWRTFCPVCKRDARTSTDEPQASESTPLLRSHVGSSFSYSSGHMSSSYIQQSFRPSPINVSRISADLREQTSPLNSSSQRSYITCMASSHSPCQPSPTNVSPFASANSLGEC